ncbi:MAG: efflux RND transporter periplasmic adaptor subunit [Chlorobi bacterium]|nr:efflux RND transporter periplasmic adaptor subunit [Chlorobiota bacterium]
MRKAGSLLIIGIILLNGCGEKKETETTDKNPIPSLKPLVVSYGTYDHYITTYGTVASQKSVNVHGEVSGKIREIYVTEGEYVKEGDPLLKIDDELLNKQFQEVKVQYELAETTYVKQKRLYEQGIGSEIAYLQAKTQRDALKTRLELLREQLQKTVVVSPISGYVNRVFVRVGQMAMPQIPLVNIVGTEKTYVDAYVPEKFYSDMKRGQTAVIEFRSLECVDTGVVKYVSPYIDPRSKSFFVRVEPKGKCEVVPNMSSVVKVYVKRFDSVAVVPMYAVVESSDGSPTVMMLEPQDSIYVIKAVRVREVASTPTTMAIDSGVPDGAFIVGIEARALSSGQHVKLLKETKR